MELRHIRYFLAVAEEMSFTKAAEKLCIAQPPLSRQIQDLENELGVVLFNRKKHALSLTDEGELFRQYAVQVINLVNHSTSEVRELKHGLQGMLNLGSVEGNAPRLIADWIAGFSKENPYVQYNLWNGNSDDVAVRIMNGLCEVAVIMEPYNSAGLESLPLFKENWVAIIPKDYAIANAAGNTIKMSDLVDYNLIIPSRESRLDEIGSWFKETGKTPKIIGRIAHIVSAYELTRKGIGVTIFPASARHIVNTDDVVIKEFEAPAPVASYIVIWNKHRELSHAAREFIAYIRRNTGA